MLTDDIKLYWVVKCCSFNEGLQKNLTTLSKGAESWQMISFVKKYKVMNTSKENSLKITAAGSKRDWTNWHEVNMKRY